MAMSTLKCLCKIAVDSSISMPLSHDRAEESEDRLCNGMQQDSLCLISWRREWGWRVKTCSDDASIESIEIGVPKHALTVQKIHHNIAVMQNI